MRAIKTIGHSNQAVERFVDLLKAGGVELLVDVRSMPYSRRFPQFGKERLAKSLAEAGIASLDRLVAAAHHTTLCLMCAEKEPLDCHRTVLVSRRLAERGVAIDHLLADGRVRPHLEVEEALLARGGGPDLFEDRAARLARAYQARERAMKRT
jgi:uncharacterized protein (DUF488 family)